MDGYLNTLSTTFLLCIINMMKYHHTLTIYIVLLYYNNYGLHIILVSLHYVFIWCLYTFSLLSEFVILSKVVHAIYSIY